MVITAQGVSVRSDRASSRVDSDCDGVFRYVIEIGRQYPSTGSPCRIVQCPYQEAGGPFALVGCADYGSRPQRVAYGGAGMGQARERRPKPPRPFPLEIRNKLGGRQCDLPQRALAFLQRLAA